MCPSHEYSLMLAPVRDAKVVRLSQSQASTNENANLFKRDLCK